MSFVKNPFGRISEVDEEDVQKWVNAGFTLPSQIEVDNFLKVRADHIKDIKLQAELDKSKVTTEGVYFVTVTQGGKDGYGVASGAILNELKKLSVDITTENLNQKTSLLFHNPYSIMKLESDIRILYTMFESTKIPEDWHDYLEFATKILVPSKWCAEVFKRAGFDAEVVPLGYNDEVFKLIERKPKDLIKENFTFIHYNAFNIRKGFVEVFKAFVQEFRPTEPVRMIFKTTLDRAPLPIPPTEYPNIEVITGSADDEDLMKLLAKSDCFVFPSRGEGFGMTPLEAMATGLPVIVPNAHGISEYFNADFMYEVKVKEECPALYSRYKGIDVGKMVVCDVDDLARQMRYIYEHQEDAIAKGKAASYYAKNWTFKTTARRLKEIMDNLASTPEKQTPLKNVLPLSKI